MGSIGEKTKSLGSSQYTAMQPSLHLWDHERIDHCFLTDSQTKCLEERHQEKHV